jgi:RNA polymerase sigma-70 factor (ECF subfamily)
MPVPAPATPATQDLGQQIEELHAAAFGWALACCDRDREDAADVLQQAYCKVFSGKARFEERSTLKTWLFGVIRLTAIEHRRWSIIRWLRSGSSAAEPRVPVQTPDDLVAEREEATQLARALACLAARQGEVLHLVFYQGLSIAEAAEVMHVSVGTARQHYERGKRSLKMQLGKEGGSP